ncbi:tyrosine-type recombinase/integrase [Methylobacillus flagellatus]|nr:tyrosine-type recombinase/integrase [Methylobacillus flagellatus]
MGRRPTVNLNLPTRMRARRRGDTTYYFYDSGGKPRKEISLGKNYAEAIRKWVELEGDAQKRASSLITIKHLADTYIERVIPGKSAQTQIDNLAELANLMKFFGNPPAPLDQIRPVHIRQYMDWRTKEGTGYTRANRERALLSHMWNKAREWGMTDNENPCAGISGFKETGRGDVYIEDEVWDAVYEHADQPLRDALDLSYLTGQRPADVRRMSEAHIQDGKLTVTQGKTSERLRIKIEGQLEILIHRIMARKENFKVRSLALIVNEHGRALSKGAMRSRFDKARKKAKAKYPALAESIANYQPRDLRGKAGSDKAEEEGMRQAQLLLGHKTIAMTEHYVRKRKGQAVGPTK